MNKQKILPHLWFDTEAIEAVGFYTSIFENSRVENITILKDTPTPTGNCEVVNFSLAGKRFMAINAGPEFKFNPSISFFLNFDPSRDNLSRENLIKIWEKFSNGGKVLMPLDKYQFSELYGWIQDRYGLSWQLILSNPEGEQRPFIIPSLLFVGKSFGRAEEAMNFYVSIFNNSRIGSTVKYPAEFGENVAGSLMFADFMLAGEWFAAMDGPGEHQFSFNEAISFLVECDTQEEIDYFWNRLGDGGEESVCGWIKDKFGIWWQINPSIMNEIMTCGDQEKIDRVNKVVMNMKKIEIAPIVKAFYDKN